MNLISLCSSSNSPALIATFSFSINLFEGAMVCAFSVEVLSAGSDAVEEDVRSFQVYSNDNKELRLP